MFFRKKSEASVKPVTLVEPCGPAASSSKRHIKKASNNNYNQYNKPFYDRRPIRPFDTLPASIPRIEIDKTTTGTFASQNYCKNAASTFCERSPRCDDISSQSSCSGTGVIPSINDSSITNSNMPLKKVTVESRWISVHDGQPVSPYIRTVAYIPKYSSQEYVFNKYHDGSSHYNNGYNLKPKEVAYEDQRYTSKCNATVRRSNSYDQCSFFVENPTYNPN